MIGRAGFIALTLMAVAAAGGERVAGQAPAFDAAALRTRVEQRFEVLPLRQGLALRPRDTTRRVRSVEIAAGTIAIDGAPATGAELRDKLGADADLILQLSYLGDAERDALFGVVTAAPTAPEPPRAPATPPSPAPPPDAPATERSAPESSRGDADRSRTRRVRGGGSDRVRFGGGVNVAADEVVNGDVVAIGGHVNVEGEVRGDVVAVGGGLTLGPRASVANNVVVVGGRLQRDPGAHIGGEIQEVGIGSVDFDRWNWGSNPLSFWSRSMVGSAFALVGTVARLAILCLLAAVVMLVGREYVERAAARATLEPLKAGAIGLLAQLLFLPILIITIVVMVITIVGIPLLILIPFGILALALIGLVGFTAVAYRVGHYVAGRLGWSTENPYLTTVGGIVVLLSPALLGRIVGLGGFPGIPITGILVFVGLMIEYLAWTIGFGSVALLRFSRPRPPLPGTAVTTAS
jgi:hypothetical protein